MLEIGRRGFFNKRAGTSHSHAKDAGPKYALHSHASICTVLNLLHASKSYYVRSRPSLLCTFLYYHR